MRRERNIQKSNGFKSLLFIYGGTILVLAITCVIVFVIYNNKLKKTAESMLSTEKIASLVPNQEEQNEIIKETSIDLSKDIKQSLNEIKNNEEEEKIEEEQEESNVQETEGEVLEEVLQIEEKKELSFIYPVEGEIIKNYAKENLVFSETLQEWTTHNGIDIKAERTSVVKAAEEGTILAIKNDPRYGLTVIIEHEDGYKTIYSNLLTAEFVVEDEKVNKGQSIGTVGNSAVFEIADEAHLHFEILKDNENLDPKAYLK